MLSCWAGVHYRLKSQQRWPSKPIVVLQDIGKKIDQNTPNVDLTSNPKDLAKKAADKASNAVPDLSAVFDLAESPTNIGDNIRVSWLVGPECQRALPWA